MDYLAVEGLSGEARLAGEVSIEGAKNAILPIMAGAVAVGGETTLTNVPMIADVHTMGALIEGLGGYVTTKDHQSSIRTKEANGTVLDAALAKRLRASVLLTGAVMARSGQVSFPHPGGCVLGSRPIDLFTDGFQKLGASISYQDETTTIEAKNGLSGGEIFFKVVSVTATETFMIAGTRATGVVTLKNCAMEPEVVALANYLRAQGARISGDGTPTIIIEPSHFEPNPDPFAILPDRIEAGSFIILGALLGKEVRISHCVPEHVGALLEALRQMGVSVVTTQDSVVVSRPDRLLPLELRTHEYPGFPTDLQAPMTVLLTQAEGESSLLETVFDGRLNYTHDLVRMGADIQVWNPHKATIKGPTPLKARDIDGPDIRAGLAFLLAASVADGTSKIGNAHLIDRGYERIEEKLQSLGLGIKRETAG